MKTVVYDFQSFCAGHKVRVDRGKLNAFYGHLQRNHKLYTSVVYFLAVATFPSASYAEGSSSTPSSGGFKLIILMQQASFWLGMAVSIWGIVEAQLDFPGWRGRILKGVLGYVGILLLPLVFMELRNSLQADVWTQINQAQHTQPSVPQTAPIEEGVRNL